VPVVIGWATRAEQARSFRDPLEAPVRTFDELVITRIVSILVLGLFVGVFRVGDGTTTLVVVLLVLALVQPLVALIWPRRSTYVHAQGFLDIASFAAFALIAPRFYTLASIVLVAVVSVHAILATTRRYAVLAGVAVGTMALGGAIEQIPAWPQIVLIALVITLSHGIVGHRARAVTSVARDDLLFAITEAGGLAHLTEVGVGVVDVIGDVEQVTGWDRKTWMATDHQTLLHPDDVDEFWVDLEGLQEGLLFDRVGRFVRPDGSWIWVRDMARVVLHAGRFHLRGFWIDVSAEYDGLARVSAEASTDELTGLPNRRSLLSQLHLRQSSQAHRLVLIDLDRFKDVNDGFGHDAGDELLRIVAKRLVGCLGPDDVLARLGGDEFAVIIDGGGNVAAQVDRMAVEVSRPVEISGVVLTTTISAGIAFSADGDASASTMLRHADIAMYAAKRAGLSWREFDAEMELQSDRQATLRAGLADALASGELGLHFQPIVDITNDRVVALEGLARWDHPLFGMLTPAAFLDVALMAENSGRFTDAMIERAVDAVESFTDDEHPIRVAVNIPIGVIEDEDFAAWVERLCADRGIDPGRLVFEVAEADPHDSASMSVGIDRLNAVGVTVSIDDFGAGNATFERLRWRDVTQLKLDGSVVQRAVLDGRERTILQSIVTLADGLGYELVAEGVESQAQLDLLRSLGCRFAQGFHLGRPAPLPELLTQLGSEVERQPYPTSSDA
jgi:diguanylate cyclase (GGDEF)-like protein